MTSERTPLISFHNVYKAFGPKRIYVGLNLEVFPGETLVILGGSGVGKSVMLKMLIGLLVPDAGSIMFNGEEIVGMSERKLQMVRQKIAMIFQWAALFDSITVGENVAYALNELYFNKMTKAEIDKRVSSALELVGLPNTQSMKPADLSGGMRKRVGLARAIALQPEVLLWDEPTTGLDPINTARINHLVMGMKKALGVTSIVVTHDMSSAFAIADRLAMVHKGRIILQDTNERFKQTSDPRVADFIHGRAPKTESLESLMGD